MRSRNPVWRRDAFHAGLVALASAPVGSRILDLGCAGGATVPHLLAAVGPSGRVVAADRDQLGLVAVAADHPGPRSDGRLVLAGLDGDGPLPFASASLDALVCHNVMECIRGRQELVAEMARILTPGGVAVVGHYDFDGVLLAGDDRDLTRRMVHGYADHTQAWQDVSEGQMGRLLPGLFAGSAFNRVETETVLFVELALTDDGYARRHLDGMVAVSSHHGVSGTDADAWLAQMEARSAAGRFYYALPWTYVVARTAEAGSLAGGTT
ncbi:MAG: methyltransferase domain-containing protein [Gluconacetobacter diazotrophicus]|nr:methyltransferase domain-containing protein [Gluconacetobacter diazotrophicus]